MLKLQCWDTAKTGREWNLFITPFVQPEFYVISSETYSLLHLFNLNFMSSAEVEVYNLQILNRLDS